MHCVERVAVLNNIIIVYAIRSKLFFIRLYEQSTTFATESLINCYTTEQKIKFAEIFS